MPNYEEDVSRTICEIWSAEPYCTGACADCGVHSCDYSLIKQYIHISEINTITVTSADNYSVDFTQAELLEESKVFAAIVADGKTIEGIDNGSNGVQIIVFGDSNSRRCVRFASCITINQGTGSI